MLSIVIPTYNEEESLAELHRELSDVAEEQGYDLDIVFVDDGSKDGSWKEIGRLAEADKRVRGVRFRRNFGKAAALSAGFRAARGDVVFTLDADLQDDPKEIPRFLAKMDEGFDVVSGYKQVRHDPWHKVLPSRVFNRMVSVLTGVKLHDHNCGFKCYRREIFDEVRLYGELHRFVPVLAAARGWTVGEVVVNHRARQFGQSKYGVWRIVKGFLDLLTVYFLTGFGQRPQHLLGALGLCSFGFGLLTLIYLAISWVVKMIFNIPDDLLPPLHQRPLMTYSMGALLLGAQFMSVGILAELITAYMSEDKHAYSIKDRVGGEPTASASPPGPPRPDDGDQDDGHDQPSGADPDETAAEDGAMAEKQTSTVEPREEPAAPQSREDSSAVL